MKRFQIQQLLLYIIRTCRIIAGHLTKRYYRCKSFARTTTYRPKQRSMFRRLPDMTSVTILGQIIILSYGVVYSDIDVVMPFFFVDLLIVLDPSTLPCRIYLAHVPVCLLPCSNHLSCLILTFVKKLSVSPMNASILHRTCYMAYGICKSLLCAVISVINTFRSISHATVYAHL